MGKAGFLAFVTWLRRGGPEVDRTGVFKKKKFQQCSSKTPTGVCEKEKVNGKRKEEVRCRGG